MDCGDNGGDTVGVVAEEGALELNTGMSDGEYEVEVVSLESKSSLRECCFCDGENWPLGCVGEEEGEMGRDISKLGPLAPRLAALLS